MHRAAVVAHEALARLGVNHRSAALAVALLSPLRSIVAPFFGSATELLGGDPGRLHPLAQSRKLVEVGADGLSHATHIDRARLAAAVRSRMISPARPERLVPIGVCALLVAAAALSSLPPVGTAKGGAAPTYGPRVVIAGLDSSGTAGATDGSVVAPAPLDTAASSGLSYYPGDVAISNTLAGPEVGTGGTGVVSSYVVASGDTLGAIAAKFGISLTSLYWANSKSLPDPESLRIGQRLIIPTIDGLVVVITPTDTLDSLAAKYSVTSQAIVDANNLAGPNIVTGDTLLIPGANGGPMPTPTPAPTAKPKPASVRVSSGGGGGSTSCSTCSAGTYAGGDFLWPVAGHSYISQRFWSGHHAIDIAAPYGTAVVAAASGVVVFAGWRSYTGGGNVIWISDGSHLYTTYNHLSAWFVQAGQTVSAGQRIGSIGTSGEATGPHLHFEVWTGYPWALGNLSDAVNPCIYLAGC